MKLTYLFITILILFNLCACNSTVLVPTATTVLLQPTATQPEFTSTATIISIPATSSPRPISTVYEWLPYNPNLSDQGCNAFTAILPVKGTEKSSQVDIAQKLFEIYLAHYKSPELGGQCRLEDFKLETVKGDSRIDFLAKEQKVEFVSRVIYSIQIKEVPSDWVAGNGELAANGWILHKGLIIGVIKVNDQYVLKLIGTGP
jgi:hypothetical protein